jgi:hypothetical protein
MNDMVYLVMCDDAVSGLPPEIDVDSVWLHPDEAENRQNQITDARSVWVEARRIGDTSNVISF